MKKQDLLMEAEKIRKLSAQQFVKETQTNVQIMLAGTDEYFAQEQQKWKLYLAAATDQQMFALAKNEYYENSKDYIKDSLETFIENMLQQREEFRKMLKLNFREREPGQIIEKGAWAAKWADEIKKLYKEHEEIKKEGFKKLGETQDHSHRV